MIDSLVLQGKIEDPKIEHAFRQVKRHKFLEGFIEPKFAYEDRAIMIKGQISSSSQPQVMALMLEALELQRGMRVLEIGTASGYNTALLCELVEQSESVYSIELERDLALKALETLEEEGYTNVSVIVGDGSKGYPDAAPYDRIIITAEANKIYPDLIKQVDGIYLTPFNFHDLVTLLVKLHSIGENKFRGSIVGYPVSFVPIRSDEISESSNKDMVKYWQILRKNISKKKINLTNENLLGLILLMISWYQADKLQNNDDYLDLIELWEIAKKPGIEDFDFFYDLNINDWQLIPIF